MTGVPRVDRSMATHPMAAVRRVEVTRHTGGRAAEVDLEVREVHDSD